MKNPTEMKFIRIKLLGLYKEIYLARDETDCEPLDISIITVIIVILNCACIVISLTSAYYHCVLFHPSLQQHQASHPRSSEQAYYAL